MWFLVCFVGLSFHLTSASPCPEVLNCITSDSIETCEARNLVYAENVRYNGCCPGCIDLPRFNESCSEGGICAPGYACKNNTAIMDFVCEPDKSQDCWYKRLNAKPDEWIPECLADGSYAPKQCKGEPMSGRCFCFDPNGNRIFGEATWQLAQNMTCGCSRFVWEQSQVRNDVTIHCDDLGNYEQLQCDDGVCWCADQFTGNPYSKVVPEKMLRTLPCYSLSKHGNQYLRQCDSKNVSATFVLNLLGLHGTTVYFPPVYCNYDGSFHRVQIANNKKLCVNKEGDQISEFTGELTENVDCNCVYDKYIAGNSFSLTCENNGNYATEQPNSGNTFCVDSDGFPTPCK